MAGIISSAIRPVFTFADEGLIEYEKIAAKKLADIIELLELGEHSNLQLAKQTYLPDDIAQISFTVMEGILAPIILVEVNRQDQSKKESELEEQEQEGPEEEERYYFVPEFHVYITTRNHVMNSYGENPNCGFEGYPPEGRLIGFEPQAEEGIAHGETEYGYNHTVESLPGLTYANFVPTWLSTHESQPGASVNRRVAIGSQSGVTRGEGLNDEGFFGDQDWHLSGNNARAVVSENGMVALENDACYATYHPDARRALFQGNVNFSEADNSLSGEFWHRSIVVGGAQFGRADIDTGEIPTRSVKRPCVHIGSDPGNASAADSITWTFEPSIEGIGGPVLSGEYEINAFVQSYSCECMDADVVIRLIIGGRSAAIEEVTSGVTKDTTTNVTWIPLIEIVDIELDTIAQGPGGQARFFARDLVLGGFGDCSEDVERGGLPASSWGFWDKAIYVNPMTGGWRIAQPQWRAPFYNTPACGLSPNDPPTDPDCLGCVGDSSVCAGSGVCSDVPFCIKEGEGAVSDVRGLAAWSLARVIRADAGNGKICSVMLVGNDGGQGGPCGEKSFSYGLCNFASGINPALPLGSDLSDEPDQGTVGGWAIGELVVVIGWSNACSGRCDGTADITTDSRWLVTKTKTGNDDFTNLFWSQFRCPGGIAWDNYLDQVIYSAAHQVDCGQFGGGQPVTLQFIDGCLRRA